MRIYIILALCFCLLVSCSSPDEKKERHYLKAMEYVKQDKARAAILELRNAIQIDAAYANARYQLGLLYLDEGNPQNAFRELLRAADLDHTNLDANLKAAEYYLITRQKDECRKVVERILQNDPGYVDGLALLANLELIEGNFDAAMTAIDKIGSAAESSDRLLNIKGRIYAAQQKWADAESTFRKAIDINSENLNNYQLLLAMVQSRNEVDKAKTLLDQMVEKFPRNPQVYLLQANFYRSQNDSEQAEAALLKTIEVEPDTAQFRLILADFYIQTNATDKAESLLLQATAEIPENNDIMAMLARIYFEQKKYAESQDLVDTIIEAEPDHKEAKLLLVRFMMKDGENLQAKPLLLKMNKDYPQWAEPYFYFGLVHLNLGEVELAQQSVAKAIQLNNYNDRYHTLMAQILQIQGEYEGAQKEASVALQLNPKNFRAALILSRALIGSKKFADAVAFLTEMEKQVPENIEIKGSLALAYLGIKDRENAEKTLDRLLEMEPGNNKAISLLLALKFQNDLPGAEKFVEERISLFPDNGGLYLLLGDILVKGQKHDNALLAYENAQRLNPEDMQPYLKTGRLLVAMGRKDEAMAQYRSMVEKQPDSIVGRMGIATLLEAEGKNAEAMEQYRKVLAIKSDFAPAANNLAWQIASSADGDLGEALKLAMMAKQAFPEEPHIADTLGWVHYKRKSYSLAIPQFEIALNNRPNDPIISYHLAQALAANGNKDRAVELLETILRDNETFAEKAAAAELLRVLKQGQG